MSCLTCFQMQRDFFYSHRSVFIGISMITRRFCCRFNRCICLFRRGIIARRFNRIRHWLFGRNVIVDLRWRRRRIRINHSHDDRFITLISGQLLLFQLIFNYLYNLIDVRFVLHVCRQRQRRHDWTIVAEVGCWRIDRHAAARRNGLLIREAVAVRSRGLWGAIVARVNGFAVIIARPYRAGVLIISGRIRATGGTVLGDVIRGRLMIVTRLDVAVVNRPFVIASIVWLINVAAELVIIWSICRRSTVNTRLSSIIVVIDIVVFVKTRIEASGGRFAR